MFSMFAFFILFTFELKSRMPIPNVSSLYQRIHKGSEGGGEFARFIDTLLIAESKEENFVFRNYSDASGDYKGADAFIISDGDFIEGIQYKFIPSPFNYSQRTAIEESVKKACEKFSEMRRLIFVTPEDIFKKNFEWLDTIRKKYKHVVNHNGTISFFNIEHWGHRRILELVLRHPHIGQKYYPELFPYDFEKFKLVKVIVNDSDIFDFHFINNTSQTFLLYEMDFAIDKMWTSIAGIIDEKYLLKSLGNFSFKVNFQAEATPLILPDPIIFKPKEPIRFMIQIKNFKECPHPFIRFKFRFNFNEGFVIESRIIDKIVY